jgi:Flp pilus assembly pilin Flp
MWRNLSNPVPIKGACIRTQGKLQANTEGSVMVEYTVLLVMVAVSASAAIYAIGMPLVERYHFMKLLLSLPLP